MAGASSSIWRAPKTRFAALWTSSGDPRHNNYVELLSSPFAGPRRFHKWSMGYSVSADENLLETFTNLNASELIQNMPDLVANIDFEP
jgi:hypothetical protein